MASTSSTISNLPLRFSSHPNRPHPLPFPVSFPHSYTPKTAGLVLCAAAKSQTGPVNKKRKKTSRGGGGSGRADAQSNSKASTLRRRNSDIDYMDDEDDFDEATLPDESLPLPKPPAGFVFDDEGKVLMASKKRIITVVDPDSKNPLDCVVRRVFRSSKGDECMVVCTADLPISLLKSTNFDGWTMIGDEETEAVLLAADYALAKAHMHLVHSGFCYTARGGFAYEESDVFNINTDDGVVIEALEIVCFHVDGAYYMIYTPVDPLMFVVIKGENGVYRRAGDEDLEDPAILSAVDEEMEFSAMAQAEKSALAEILNGGGE